MSALVLIGEGAMKKLVLFLFLAGCGSEIESVKTDCPDCKKEEPELICKPVAPQSVSCKHPDGSTVIYNTINVNTNVNVNVGNNYKNNHECDDPSQH